MAGAKAEETITEVTLRQVTPASASFTWWTPGTSSVLWRSTEGWWPGPTRLCRIVCGTTPECKDGAADSYGDLYHRVTLFDLKPASKYYYRIELAGKPVKTEVAEFITPGPDWQLKRRTLYVAPSGSDANDGLSREKAWRTLAKASEEARAGDTVIVADGVYRETIAPVASGVASAPITFKAENLNSAILEGSNFHRPAAVYAPLKEHVVIDGFVMRQFAPKNLGRRAGMEYAQVVLWSSRNITLQNCVQYGYGNYGFAGVLMWARDITLRNNAIVGFEGGWEGRNNGRVTMINNTWYVPMITDMNLGKTDLVLKNNLFFGKEEQKYRCALFRIPAGSQADYNGYAFHANDKFRHIGSARFVAEGEGAESAGLKTWQAYGKCDAHGIELPASALKFAQAPIINSYDPAFGKFWAPYNRGEKAPTLALFDLPAGSPLNQAGENGAPIGARPPK